jgi:hypothetical protein
MNLPGVFPERGFGVPVLARIYELACCVTVAGLKLAGCITTAIGVTDFDVVECCSVSYDSCGSGGK